MERLTLKTAHASCAICIGSGAVASALPERPLLLVIDANVARLHGERVRKLLRAPGEFVIPSGEEHKSLATVEQICRRAAELHLERDCVFAACGGGVTGDLTGFASAVYLRGVDFIQLPTTLLAMVDSAIGGKTGADLPEGKNLVGAFHQPLSVGSDPEFLSTLPPQEWSNGLAEMIKTGVILDAGLFAELEKLTASGLPSTLPESVLARCCRLKAGVVAEDEYERGRRAILNYGHTCGHAVERLSGFALPHGAAVAIGMTVAAELAVRRGRLTSEAAARQKKLLLAAGLPVGVPRSMSAAALLEAMRSDKKVRDGRIVFVLPQKIGAADAVSDLSCAEIAAAVEACRL